MGGLAESLYQHVDEGRSRLAENGRLVEERLLVPELDIRTITRGKTIAQVVLRGGHARTRVVAARLTPDSLENVRKRFPNLEHACCNDYPFALKERSLREYSSETMQKRLARSVWLSDDRQHRDNRWLGHTLGYAFTHKTAYFLLRREQTTFESVLHQLHGSQTAVLEEFPEMQRAIDAIDVRGALSILRTASRGLAQFHSDNGVHRDIKPSNIGLSMEDGAIMPRLHDYDLAVAIMPDTHCTTYMGGGALAGTPNYMPSRLLIGDFEWGDLREMTRDTYAMGVMIARTMQKLPERTAGYPQHLEELMRSDALLEQAERAGMPGLERVVVRALLEGYPHAAPLADHLDAVLSGRPEEIYEDQKTRDFWNSRSGRDYVQVARESATRTASREMLKKIRTGAAALAGAAFIFVGVHDCRNAHKFMEEYDRSPQAAARNLAAQGLSPNSLDQYTESLLRALQEDERHHYAPQRNSGIQEIVPQGSWISKGGHITYTNTTGLAYKGFLEYLLALHGMRGGDSVAGELAAIYIANLEIERSGDDPDYLRTAVARVEPIIAYPDLIAQIRSGLDEDARTAMDEGIRSAKRLALFGAAQMHWNAHDPGVNVRHDYRLALLCSQIAMHPDILEENLAAADMEELSRRWGVSRVSIDDLVENLSRTAAEADSLVMDDGKSFGRKTAQGMRAYHPLAGEGVPAEDQPVILQDAARIYAAQSYRLHAFRHILEKVQSGDGEYSFRDPGETHRHVQEGIEHAQRSIRILDAQFEKYTGGWERLPPPVQYFRQEDQNILSVFPSDALATTMYLHGLIAQERFADYQTITRSVLEKERMRTPQRPDAFLWSLWSGFLPPPYEVTSPDGSTISLQALDLPYASLGYPSHDGPNPMATGLMARALFDFSHTADLRVRNHQ